MSATTGRQGRSSAIDRKRRLDELNRETLRVEQAEAAERQAEAERQRQARDRRDAGVRAAAYRLQQRRAEARQHLEAAQDEYDAAAGAFAHGQVDEQDLLAAHRRREEARVVADALELGFRELRGDPAVAGRH